MNAVERLEAAITKLEKLKAASWPGAWTYIDGEIRTDEGFCLFEHHSADRFIDGRLGDTAEPQAQLVVTLHRTIDAQLAILRTALIVATPEPGFMHSFDTGPGSTVGLGLALADAILGGD